MALFERVRKNPIVKKLYRLPGISKAYHLGIALAGAVIYGFPSRRLVVVGITGTKGKTTVTEFLGAVLETAGHKVATISSVRFRMAGKETRNRTGNSMPGRSFIQRFLRDAADAGCTHAVVEVTSEGAVQARHKFIEWNVAVITNIAPEHIENHGSFENYRKAKLSFLQYAVGRGATAFVNADDRASEYFKDNLPDAATVMYSKRAVEGWPESAFAGLPGEFNRQNVAAALEVARKLNIPDAAVLEALATFKGVPGRMEFVVREPFRVVVDYAHTADSMEAAYKALRADMKEGQRLIAVFGSCGGHRDKWKRPVMGEVAAHYADEIILTNEDPYDEDPMAILGDIEKGIEQARDKKVKNISKVIDRSEAIREAVGRAKPGDTVIMTGKGSELYIHVANGKTIDWSDKREAEQAILEKKEG